MSLDGKVVLITSGTGSFGRSSSGSDVTQQEGADLR